METGRVTNAERLLRALDAQLQDGVELTLYGRAALALGFPNAPSDFALSRDVDAVLALGQAEALLATTNFWAAVQTTNDDLADEDLYISHFFTEDQVILLPDWQINRVQLDGEWIRLRLYRLGNLDLLLSKLMRDDPLDMGDARFIASAAGLSRGQVEEAIRRARVPDSPEIREQFALASSRLLQHLT